MFEIFMNIETRKTNHVSFIKYETLSWEEDTVAAEISKYTNVVFYAYTFIGPH